MKFWTVDAFTKEPFRGNPAAVFLVDEFPSEKMCRKVAEEINLSETAFLKRLGASEFHIRWFNPQQEIKLCGHATLASSHILVSEGFLNSDKILYKSLSGHLEVQVNSKNSYVLNFPLQSIKKLSSGDNLKNLFPTAIDMVEAGEDLIVELKSESEVKSFQPDFIEITNIDYRGVIITSKGSDHYDFVSRFFAPKIGVNEDPVTGSAHCKLADYWSQKLQKNAFVAYQASKRGGIIALKIENNRVLMEGTAVTIASGMWLPKMS